MNFLILIPRLLYNELILKEKVDTNHLFICERVLLLFLCKTMRLANFYPFFKTVASKEQRHHSIRDTIRDTIRDFILLRSEMQPKTI